MGFIKSILVYMLIFVGAEKSISLRAQQSPCYEFLCGAEPSLLCGSDGVTYLNGCLYSQAQCKDHTLYVRNPGNCSSDNSILVEEGNEIENVQTSTTPLATNETISPATDACTDSFCPARYDPVCGKDGISYSNICQFTKTQCRTPDLELSHIGRCKSYENCMTRICPMREESICSNTGKTFRNICELSIAKCYNPKLAPAYNGPCDPATDVSNVMDCDTPCEDQYRPVCATNSVTYPNICHFENAQCKNNKLKIYKFEPC